jgi:hypothetical protein
MKAFTSAVTSLAPPFAWSPSSPRCFAQRPGLETHQALHGMHALARDRRRPVLGELFDVDATFGRRDDDRRLCGAIHDDREIHLAVDVAAGLDVEGLDDPALRTGLGRDDRLAEQALRDLLRLVGAAHELHAAGLAAASGVDLHLDHRERLVQRDERLADFVDRLARDALADGHAELRQQLLGLILVDVHGTEGRDGNDRVAPRRSCVPILDEMRLVRRTASSTLAGTARGVWGRAPALGAGTQRGL